MKTKNEYLKEQGIDLEKDFSVGTYTKIRFAMENYANDYHKSEVKKFCLAAVSGRSEQLVAFLKWVGDGYDFENNAEKIVKDYIDEGN